MLPLTINKNATLTLDCNPTSLEGLNLTLVLLEPNGDKSTMEFTRDGNEVTTKFYASSQRFLGMHRLTLYKNYGASGQAAIKAMNFRLVPVSEATRRTSGEGGGGSYTVDSELSATSTNPVQNKVVTLALDDKMDTDSALTNLEIEALLK